MRARIVAQRDGVPGQRDVRALALLVLLASCSSSVPPCSAASCASGCCDSAGRCVSCGAGGGAGGGGAGGGAGSGPQCTPECRQGETCNQGRCACNAETC